MSVEPPVALAGCVMVAVVTAVYQQDCSWRRLSWQQLKGGELCRVEGKAVCAPVLQYVASEVETAGYVDGMCGLLSRLAVLQQLSAKLGGYAAGQRSCC